MSRPRALLLESIHPVAASLLTDAGYAVDTTSGALRPEELRTRLAGVELLGVRSASAVTAEVIDAADSLTAVGAFCIGTNHLDLPAATAAGVAVFNAPFHNTRSVVEMAISEIISLTRRMPEQDRALHEGFWNKSAAGSHEVRGRTLGIVGYGNVGSQLSVLAEMLGMNVVFYDITDKLSYGNATRCSSLPELLALSDVVSLHVDGRSRNTAMFGAEQFAAMRPGAVFLNLSRGFVIDEQALAAALDSGHLKGAALDVFEKEPDAKGDPFESPLRGRANVILTPHTAGSTEEAQQEIGRYVAGKLIFHARDGGTDMSVNLPRTTAAPTPGTVRIAHLHRNVPGALAAVNSALADSGANIVGQTLATEDSHGYCLVDLALPQDAEMPPSALLERLNALPANVRTRYLDTSGVSLPAAAATSQQQNGNHLQVSTQQLDTDASTGARQ